MAHALDLRLAVPSVVVADANHEGNAFHHVNAVGTQLFDLVGIVRQQRDLPAPSELSIVAATV